MGHASSTPYGRYFQKEISKSFTNILIGLLINTHSQTFCLFIVLVHYDIACAGIYFCCVSKQLESMRQTKDVYTL
jgi:hypothetical protein